MARITKHRGSAKATHDYYLADYYDAGPEFGMRWLGEGARRLGLAGAVDSKQFMRLLENRHPHDDHQLTPRQRDDRLKGWDINFNVPKSVSIAFGLNNDTDIAHALRESVNETLLDMQHDVMVRDNTSGRGQRHRRTENFVAAVQIHPDARGVDGQTPDPNIHAHAFVANVSFDEPSKRWLAADIPDIYRDAQGFYEAAFQSRLATRLQALGYKVERSDHNFEITGVSMPLIEKFSKRSNHINALIDKEKVAAKIANKHGISLADAKGMVGALSRDQKKSYSLDELQQDWQSQLTPAESRELDQLRQQKERPNAAKEKAITAHQAVSFALQHGFAKESVLRERHVLRDAIKFGIGDNTVDEITAELASRDLIRQGKHAAAIVTTRALQQEEQTLLDFARNGRGAVKPLNPNHRIEREFLSDEQKQAITGLLSSPDRVQLLRGVAGVGKSTSLEELAPAITSTGRSLAVMAPTNKAVDNLIADGFKQATTVASFIGNEQAIKRIKGGVILVDEAGLIDTPTFLQLTDIAQQQNARIIAVGDERQHLPIGRGHPFKQLQKQAGITPKSITQIRRQRDAYKDAVEALSRGDIANGFKQLDTLEFVHEIADDQDRNTQLAKQFADDRETYPRQNQLVIAPTHAERRQVIAAIRDELKARKIIHDNERDLGDIIHRQLKKSPKLVGREQKFTEVMVAKLKSRQLIQGSDEELANAIHESLSSRTDADHQELSGIIVGELKARNLIVSSDRQITTYVSKQLSEAQQQWDALSFRPGDVVAFHARGRGGIQSGDKLTVAEVTKDKVFAEGGQEIPLESAGAFAVFRPETSSYAVGDVIRLTRGRRAEDGRKKLTNGSLHTIQSFHHGVVTLDNGEKLGSDFRFWDHGIAVTSHVSQGTTVHRAYVAASSVSFPASSPEQMYVSASRAKKRVDIFTDSSEGLRHAISQFRPKPFASDVKPEPVGRKPGSRFNRIKQMVHQFATGQLKRFGEWLPGNQIERQLAR